MNKTYSSYSFVFTMFSHTQKSKLLFLISTGYKHERLFTYKRTILCKGRKVARRRSLWKPTYCTKLGIILTRFLGLVLKRTKTRNCKNPSKCRICFTEKLSKCQVCLKSKTTEMWAGWISEDNCIKFQSGVSFYSRGNLLQVWGILECDL